MTNLEDLKINTQRINSDKIFDSNVFMSTFLRNFLKLTFSKGVFVSVTSNKDTTLLKSYLDKFLSNPSVTGAESINEFGRRILNAIIRHGDVLVYATTKNDFYNGSDDIKLNIVPASYILTPPDKAIVKHCKDGSTVNLKNFVVNNGYCFEESVIKGYCIKSEVKEEYIYFPRFMGDLFVSTCLKSPIDAGNPFDKRPKPSITPAISTLLDVTKLITSEVKAQTFKTKIPAILEFLNDVDDETIGKAQQNLQNLLTEISTNDVQVLVSQKGTKLSSIDLGNQKETNIKTFIEPLLRYVSGIFGVSYDALINDISNASGATARATYVQAFTDSEIWRTYLYSQLLNPVTYLICDFLELNPDDYEWQYSVKPFTYIKAKEEYESNDIAIRTGQKTLYEVITEQGYNPEEMSNQNKYIESIMPKSNTNYEMLEKTLLNFNENKYTYNQAMNILISLGYDYKLYIGEKDVRG